MWAHVVQPMVPALPSSARVISITCLCMCRGAGVSRWIQACAGALYACEGNEKKKDKGQEGRLTEAKRARAGRERRPEDAGDHAQLLCRRLLQAQAHGRERAAEGPGLSLGAARWSPPGGGCGRPAPRDGQFAGSPASLCAPPPRTTGGSRRGDAARETHAGWAFRRSRGKGAARWRGPVGIPGAMLAPARPLATLSPPPGPRT